MALNKKEIIISSDTLNLGQIELFLREIFNSLNIDISLFNRVLLCVNEAVINSISHGNRFDDQKNVMVQSFYCKEYLFFRITDQGEGFNYADLPDPTTEENIRKESGRGIYFIKKISGELYFRDHGKVVEFKIRLDE